VAECQPPSGEKQPHDIANHTQRAGADVFATEIFVARYGLVSERQQRVDGDTERARAQQAYGPGLCLSKLTPCETLH
jgi:hypothetical protein